MTQQTSPWLEAYYGWNFGESGWNSGMDQNLLKFSFMFDGNVDDIVSTLPPAVNGKAYYLTSDNRLYFAAGTTYYSSLVPKWFIIKVRTTGATWQYNGTTLVRIENPSELTNRIDDIELTITQLGTAAFENTEFFATQSALEIAEATSAGYTDAFINSLADPDLSLGASLVTNSVRRCNDVAALRTTAGRYAGDTIITTSFSSSNPGIGGGSWYWDETDTSADNGGFIVAVTGVVTGRWRRVFTSLAINASWFGAVPDYDTSTGTGTDSAPAINAALASSQSAVVELDRGRFKVGTSINLALRPSGTVLRGAGGGKIGNSQRSTELYGETGDYPVLDLLGSQFIKIQDLCVLSGFNTPSTVGVHIARELTSQFAQFNLLERVTIQIATSPSANGGSGSVAIHNIAGEIFTMRDVYALADTPVYISSSPIRYNVQSIYGTLYTGITSTSTFYFEGNCVFQNYLNSGAGVWLDGVTFATGAFYINGLLEEGTYGVKLTGICRGLNLDAFVERSAHFAMIDNGLNGCKLRFHGVLNPERKVLRNPATGFVSVLNTEFEFISTVSGPFTAPDYWIDNAAGDRLTNCRVIAPAAPSVAFSRSTSNNRRCEFVSDVSYQQQFTDIMTNASVYTLPPLKLGAAQLWHDTFGMLRTKASAPSNATDGAPYGLKVALPASAVAPGSPGQWAADSSFFYVYTGDGVTHSWRRVAVTAW